MQNVDYLQRARRKADVAPMSLFMSLTKDAWRISRQDSSADRNNSRPLFSCIYSSITNDCVPVAVLYFSFLCIISTWTHWTVCYRRFGIDIAYLWQPKTFWIDRFDLVMTLKKLSMRRSYPRVFFLSNSNEEQSELHEKYRWTLLCLSQFRTVVTQAESIVPHLQLPNVEQL